MALQYSTTVNNARLDQIETTISTTPSLLIFSGSAPANCAAADTGTLLATLTITGALGTASSGVIDFNETVTQTNSSHVAGTPTFILVTTSADAAVCTLAIGTDATFTGTVATGVDISITAGATITAGAGTGLSIVLINGGTAGTATTALGTVGSGTADTSWVGTAVVAGSVLSGASFVAGDVLCLKYDETGTVNTGWLNAGFNVRYGKS